MFTSVNMQNRTGAELERLDPFLAICRMRDERHCLPGSCLRTGWSGGGAAAGRAGRAAAVRAAFKFAARAGPEGAGTIARVCRPAVARFTAGRPGAETQQGEINREAHTTGNPPVRRDPEPPPRR
nr:hypothetical protein GCM10020063_083420 [Dactylosporangium thailandense]